ncbi:MAG: hypothetical protein ACYSYM_15120, partial [Planctomycetota bacterium]
LLAILLPALRKARTLTKRISCQNNLKQIAVAWKMYLDDNDGRFYQAGNANLLYGGWSGTRPPSPRPLNKYFSLPVNLVEETKIENDARVFCCPSDRGGASLYEPLEKAYNLYGTSYQTNCMLIGPDQMLIGNDKFAVLHVEVNKRLKNLTIGRVNHHSRLLLVGDYGWYNQCKPLPHPNKEVKELAEWHGREDCHNMVFLDSHVEFLNIRKGFYVTDEYTMVPFDELLSMAREIQEQLP